MRKNPYKISDRGGISPRIKLKLNNLPKLMSDQVRLIRYILIGVGVLAAGFVLYYFLKPETTLMSSVEVERVRSRGVLSVGVRDDMPGFCEDGKGLEAELALLLAEYMLPDSEDALKLVPCTSKTVTTKLSDGTIDLAIALQSNSLGSGYSYSYPYFTDKVYLVTLDEANAAKDPWEMKLGYVPVTGAGSVFESYVSSVNTTSERTLIDKLLGRAAPTPDPETAITVDSKKYGSFDELLTALHSGEIDAAALSGAYIHKYFDVYGDGRYFVCDTVVGTLEYRIVGTKDEPALTQVADMLIFKLKEDGTLDALREKYLPPELK